LRDLSSRLREVPGHRPVLVICRSGRRSAEAARILAGPLGGHRADVANVEGGMAAWANAGFPVLSGSGVTGQVA
jgi:rhodanese-related sulfurtransferase